MYIVYMCKWSQLDLALISSIFYPLLSPVVPVRSEIESSRKWGTFFVANQLIKMYFKLQQSNLCKNILRAIDASELPHASLFPQSHIVTFKYHVGLIHFTEGRFNEAECELLYAFQHCLGSAMRQKRQLLHYLIPCRLLKGIAPHPTLLHQYGLETEYAPLLSALCSGNVSRYNQIVQEHEKNWARRGTLLAFEKLAMLAHRQLFKKMYKTRDMHVSHHELMDELLYSYSYSCSCSSYYPCACCCCY